MTDSNDPTEVVEGSFKDTARPAFTSQNIRFTTRGETLYATVLSVSHGEVAIRSLGSHLRLYPKAIGKVELVGSSDPLAWVRDGEALRVSLPDRRPSDHAVALRITPAEPSHR